MIERVEPPPLLDPEAAMLRALTIQAAFEALDQGEAHMRFHGYGVDSVRCRVHRGGRLATDVLIQLRWHDILLEQMTLRGEPAPKIKEGLQ